MSYPLSSNRCGQDAYGNLLWCGIYGSQHIHRRCTEQLLTGKGIDPEYKDADMDYEVTRSDIKILKQIHSLGDAQYKRLMAYMKALQKLEQMENMVEE